MFDNLISFHDIRLIIKYHVNFICISQFIFLPLHKTDRYAQN